MATSYSNPGGTGDRTSSITVTASFTPSGGTLSNAVDGATATNGTDSWWAAFTVTTSSYIRFDFGASASKKIDEITWKQSNTTSMGTWTIRGSNNGTDWTTLKSSFALGGATTQVIGSFDETGYYRYYEFRGVSGSFSSSPWCQEVEFKIEDYFTFSVTFDDAAKCRFSVREFISPSLTQITTPGSDTFVIPAYDRLIIEMWGAGASGAACAPGAPTQALLGNNGGATTISYTQDGETKTATAGGGQKPAYAFNWEGGAPYNSYNRGGLGGTTSGNIGIGFDGQKGEDGRSGAANWTIDEYGARGGAAPFGGAGGPRAPRINIPIPLGNYNVGVGQDGEAPGGGGGSAGIGGYAGPPLWQDGRFSSSFGGGGGGGYRRIVFDYMDINSPEPGTVVSYTVGAGGEAPAGATYYGTVDADGGAGGNGAIYINADFVPEPPPPDGGQGTASISYTSLRAGDFLTLVYNYDDPDGGETAFHIVWKRNGTPITGGTGSYYQLQPEDVGANITADVTYTDALGYTETITTSAVGPILPEKAPLDDLTTGLFAAYSTRLLVSSYTGPLIRLRANTTLVGTWGWQQTGTPANSGNYIRFDFGTPRVVTEAWLHQNSYDSTNGQGVFKWQGSNDGSTWTDIGSSFVLNQTTINPAPKQTELNGNTTAYRYYQLLGISGNWANHLIWEMEFKIDDGGQTSRIGAPGGYSYQNPGGEGPRSDQITVTTSFSQSGIQKLVSGQFSDAQKSFWPKAGTRELDIDELTAWYDAVSPLASPGSQIIGLYDQSGNGRHLTDFAATGQLPVIWDTSGVFYKVPKGRLAARSNGNQIFRNNTYNKPSNALYFAEVTKRDNDRPIRNWNFAFTNIVSFSKPVSTANDWLANQAVLTGNGLASGAPRAITNDTFPATDSDAVFWEGGLNASRVGIKHNGKTKTLSVASTGYTNEAGTQTFMWPLQESQTDRQIRLCELVFWNRDVNYLDAEAMALYRIDAMAAWLDEMPGNDLFVSFSDGAELDVDFEQPIVGPSLIAEMYDGAFMSAYLDGVEIEFSSEFFDNASMTVVFDYMLPPPLPVQLIIINKGT